MFTLKVKHSDGYFYLEADRITTHSKTNRYKMKDLTVFYVDVNDENNIINIPYDYLYLNYDEIKLENNSHQVSIIEFFDKNNNSKVLIHNDTCYILNDKGQTIDRL